MTTTTVASDSTLRRPLRNLVHRAALITAGVAVLLAGGILAAGAVAKLSLASAHPPPGDLVDIGTARLHLSCMGGGVGPTVILEAGNADFSVMWSSVQPALATSTTKVCAYDRAGLGWSESIATSRTLRTMTDELALLLDAGGIQGDLVLVGHSFGGIMARSFAATYPERVAGLVLLDAAHEQQFEVSPTMLAAVESGVSQFRGLVPMASLGLLAMMPHTIPDRGLPADAHADYVAILGTTGYFAAAAEETAMLPANLEAIARLPRDLGDLPVTVVSRGRADIPPGAELADLEEMEAAWASLQADLVGLSEHSRHVNADQSGHYVQLEQPELVVAAVRQILDRS